MPEVATLRYDGDASHALAEMTKMTQKEKLLSKELLNTAKTATAGGKAAQAALKAQAAEVVRVRGRIEELKLAYKNLSKGGNQANKTLGLDKMQVTALSQGLDDFAVVASMQGGWQGIISGARAASNNLSMLLGGISPLLFAVPGLASAALTLGYNFLKSSNDVEKGEKALERFGKTADSVRKKLRELQMGQEAVARQNEANEINTAISDIDKKILEQQDVVSGHKHGIRRNILGNIPGLGGFANEPLFDAEQQLARLQGQRSDLLARQREVARFQAEADKKAERERKQQETRDAIGRTASALSGPLNQVLDKNKLGAGLDAGAQAFQFANQFLPQDQQRFAPQAINQVLAQRQQRLNQDAVVQGFLPAELQERQQARAARQRASDLSFQARDLKDQLSADGSYSRRDKAQVQELQQAAEKQSLAAERLERAAEAIERATDKQAKMQQNRRPINPMPN
ncbi:hypothetical protein Pan216_12780 [Planctomycetes bacterium Pan216]|uniref:Uncharacterized protein n=1 Tax=Kolteria novifilia TaxID=2527975 RepID=A0A518B0C7_9BACT|nr:hypothetical protein Pan216_12780 [Planctomycetes bacterium Pan216]